VSWYSRWKKRRRDKREQTGYEFAAGVLLADKWEGVADLVSLVDNAKSFNCYDEFDMGIQRALRRWQELNK
jgi:hypothetical protein